MDIPQAAAGRAPGDVRVTPTRPALRWHGGKWMLAPWIIDHFPPHRVYTEVFGGAMSVLLRKPRSYAEVYNDLDGEVVNFFRVLQDPAAAARLTQLLAVTPFARAEFQLAYEPATDPVERARRLAVISFMGFGSNGHNTSTVTGFRANNNRAYSTPADDWSRYPNMVAAFVARLRRVVIESRPAAAVLKAQDAPSTLHYVDPPYVHSTRDPGKRQRDYRHEMTDGDHVALAKILRQLKGMVVLSGYPCALYEELYGDWHRVERSALADGARKRTEVLWINDAGWRAARAQGKLL